MDAYLVRVPSSDESNILRNAELVGKRLEQASREAGLRMDLGEAWAGLHFMLTGETPIPKQQAASRGVSWNDGSIENVLMGGDPTPYEASFGPARYVRASQVKYLTKELSNIDVEDFASRYDSEALMDEHIPPETWDNAGEAREWLTQSFIRLVNFYAMAAARDEGILVYFT